ncbi:sortase [Allofournierella massiliensis]|uniref:sortase n=1 Tax=Allofournierella massiliensis TaxID=1650663 RepID=UPI0039A36882
MRKAIGIGCVILGVVCLIVSVGFVLFNHLEDKKAQEASQVVLHSAQHAIQEQDIPSQPPIEETDQSVPKAETEELNPEMSTIIVDGYDCIGILSIPVLELELPIFTGWSYEKLKIAPCHYYGSYISGDFVIAGHNYKAHFGLLSELQPQDLIIFTDAEGTIHQYEVFLLETLTANATKEMISSGFDLSLYTCTPGGSNRVTVRCLAKDFTEPQ